MKFVAELTQVSSNVLNGKETILFSYILVLSELDIVQQKSESVKSTSAKFLIMHLEAQALLCASALRNTKDNLLPKMTLSRIFSGQ